jgi:hypothetical protein
MRTAREDGQVRRATFLFRYAREFLSTQYRASPRPIAVRPSLLTAEREDQKYCYAAAKSQSPSAHRRHRPLECQDAAEQLV